MTVEPFVSPTFLLMGLPSGVIINSGSAAPCVVMPDSPEAREWLSLGTLVHWFAGPKQLRIGRVVAAPMRWRQGELFIRIREAAPASIAAV